MRLHHIVGNTFYINYPSIVGVYKFTDNSCLLIDSGASRAFGLRTMKILAKHGLKVDSIINTHFHGDHSGGNQVIQEETKCHIYASKIDKVFLENPILCPYGIYSAYPIKPLQNKFLMQKACLVNHTIEEDTIRVNQETFQIVNLSGHTLGQIGIITPDKVLFAGDAIISQGYLRKFPFLYMANLDYQLATIERLRDIACPYKVVSHGGLIDNWSETIAANEEQIQITINIILDFIKEAKSREAIYQEVIDRLDLPINTSQYFLISASISAFLSYLHTNKIIKIVIEDKQVKFICK